MRLVHDIPSEFTDEDRFFKYFNKKSFVILLISILIGLGIFNGFKLLGYWLAGLIIAAIFILVVMVPVMMTKPNSDYMRGGGQTFSTILLKKFLRRREKVIYVKGWENEVDLNG